jgi:hypothetical protein
MDGIAAICSSPRRDTFFSTTTSLSSPSSWRV